MRTTQKENRSGNVETDVSVYFLFFLLLRIRATEKARTARRPPAIPNPTAVFLFALFCARRAGDSETHTGGGHCV